MVTGLNILDEISKFKIIHEKFEWQHLLNYQKDDLVRWFLQNGQHPEYIAECIPGFAEDGSLLELFCNKPAEYMERLRSHRNKCDSESDFLEIWIVSESILDAGLIPHYLSHSLYYDQWSFHRLVSDAVTAYVGKTISQFIDDDIGEYLRYLNEAA